MLYSGCAKTNELCSGECIQTLVSSSSTALFLHYRADKILHNSLEHVIEEVNHETIEIANCLATRDLGLWNLYQGTIEPEI